ncbi:MAG: ATPase, T2SS/T4P/T4SS family, partial [Candidatus Pacearchaeota archaeon]
MVEKQKKDEQLYSYEVKREGGEDIIYINYLGAPFIPSLAGSPNVMERTITALAENPNVSRIIFVQQKNYNYDSKETFYLIEIANFYTYLVKQEKILSKEKLAPVSEQFFPKRYNEMFAFLTILKRDPIAAYYELKKLIIQTRIFLDKIDAYHKSDHLTYLSLLEKIYSLMNELSLIKEAQKYLKNYKKGDREIYENIFRPDVIPNFTFTRLITEIPYDVEIIDQYEISSGEYDKSIVMILKKKDEPKLIYHIIPPENVLLEEQNMLLNLARKVLIEHQPKAEEFTDTERTRQVFFNISKDLLNDLAQSKQVKIDYLGLNKLATILVRHTIGFGILEVLLQDKKIQDISLNAPISMIPIFIRHQDYDECLTNIIPSQEDIDSWAAKFRLISGRPLDEANPILDTQLEIGKIRARIAIVQKPLSPDGLAYAIRRHREDPWTLPLFVQNKMLNPLAAGLLSFLIDGSRTLLVAGTRSSGKTSLLGSLMLEIIPKYRIIVIEDSLELPVESLRKLKYDILRMKVRSALLKTTTEVSADDGIRTSLRLGDSCLIIGEVRSVEAQALYEAMRVGALANVVAGTIHGASPYGV